MNQWLFTLNCMFMYVCHRCIDNLWKQAVPVWEWEVHHNQMGVWWDRWLWRWHRWTSCHMQWVFYRSTTESSCCWVCIHSNPTIHLSDKDFVVFCLQWPKHVNRQSSAVQTVLTGVYQAHGAVTERLTVRMELMKIAVVSHFNYRLWETYNQLWSYILLLSEVDLVTLIFLVSSRT